MTTRSQKRKAVAELASGEFEASTSENNLVENVIAGPSKSPIIQAERLDEIKMSLRREFISDLTKIFADNQKEMLKLIAPTVKKTSTIQNVKNSSSEPESVLPNTSSTPIETNTTTSKTTPVNSRNRRQQCCRHFNANSL